MTPAEFRDSRLAAGLSVRQAAARLHVAPSSITRWESGARGIPSEVADLVRVMAEQRGERDMTDTDTLQATALGGAIRVLQEITGLHELPLTVSQGMGARALGTMSRMAHQPQNRERLHEREDELGDLLSEIDPTWLAASPVLPPEAQSAAWLGYYSSGRVRSHQPAAEREA